MSGPNFTRVDIKTILHRYYGSDDHHLLDYSTRPLSDELEGFLGEHYWLDIHTKHGDNADKITLFTKMQPIAYELQHEYCMSMGAFENETFFYDTLMPEFKKYVPNFDESITPKYYFGKNNFVVVLENCGLSNYVIADCLDEMSIDHIQVALKEFAKLHGASLVYEEKKTEELGKPYRLIDDYQQYLNEPFFRFDEDFLGYKWHTASVKCIDAIIDLLPDDDREEFRVKFHKLVRQCFEIVKPTTKFRNVCCHGDVWRKNLMFKYSNNTPIDCKLIDFQLIKYNPPIYDLLKFVHQVTSSQTRQRHFDDLIHYYYDHLCQELRDGGVDPNEVIPCDQLQASLKHVLPYVKIEALFYYSYQKPGAEFLMKLMADKEAFKIFSFGDRSTVVKEFYYEGSYFKKWLDELIYEIKDIVDNDSFSREDCRVVLRNKFKSTDYELLKYHLYSIGEHNGFLGEHKKLQVLLKHKDKQQELTFFVKQIPTTEFNQFTIESGAFDNETFCYEHAFRQITASGIKELNECVAKYYFSRRNDVIVIEDLHEHGYKSINNRKSLDYNHICVIIKALAKLHSSTLIYEENMTKKLGKKFRTCEKYRNKITEVCYPDNEQEIGKFVKSAINGIHTHIDLFSDAESTITDEVFKKKVEYIYGDLMYKFSASSKEYRNVICHGDLWASNILIKYEDNQPLKAKLVDFQCVKLCPPAQDLMVFIYLTTSRKFRANYISEVIQLYHKELSSCLMKYDVDLNEILPLKDFERSCEYYKTMAIAMTVSHMHFIMADSKGMDLLFTDNRLCYQTFYVDRSEFIIKMCRTNPQYKKVLGECLKDLRMMCENLEM